MRLNEVLRIHDTSVPPHQFIGYDDLSGWTKIDTINRSMKIESHNDSGDSIFSQVSLSMGLYIFGQKSNISFISILVKGSDIKDYVPGIDDNKMYNIFTTKVKDPDKRTYNILAPELDRYADRIIQVDTTTIEPSFEGNKLAPLVYNKMSDANYLMCSDRWQSGGGENIWNSLIRNRAPFDNKTSTSAEKAVVLLTTNGFLMRDIRGHAGQELIKPFTRNDRRVPDSRGKFTLSSDWAWSDEDGQISTNNVMFYGKMSIINEILKNNKVPKIGYTEYKNFYNSSTPDNNTLSQSEQNSGYELGMRSRHNQQYISPQKQLEFRNKLIQSGLKKSAFSYRRIDPVKWDQIQNTIVNDAKEENESADQIFANYVNYGSFNWIMPFMK